MDFIISKSSSFIKSTFNEPKSRKTHMRKSKTKKNFCEVMTSTFVSKIEDQQYVNNTGVLNRKIGRPSSCKIMTSKCIFNFMKKHMKEQILNSILKSDSLMRFDILIVEYFRLIRRVPNFFTKNFATQIYLKSTDILTSTIGFIEAASAYFLSKNNFSDENIVERIVDFSVIYFSSNKCNNLIKKLSCDSNRNIKSCLKNKLKILKIRNKTSISSMKNFVNLSPTLKELFSLALEILTELKEPFLETQDIDAKNIEDSLDSSKSANRQKDLTCKKPRKEDQLRLSAINISYIDYLISKTTDILEF